MAKCAIRARHDRFPLMRPLSAAEISEALACDRPTADVARMDLTAPKRSLDPQWRAARAGTTVCREAKGQCSGPRLLRFKRKAFVITDAELRLIASAAIMGESSNPVNGYSTPAAIGIPSAL